MRVDVCKAVILDAIQHHGDASDTIGFGFGGDGNCSFATWQLAFAEVLQVSPGRSPFDDPHYMIGVNAKDGDVMIGCGVPGLRFEKKRLRHSKPRPTTRLYDDAVVLHTLHITSNGVSKR